MIRIAICDDSPGFLQQTKFMIDHWEYKPQQIITEMFEYEEDLIAAHASNPFDILLLDIIMPLSTGIEIAREIRENDKTVKIVFLTSSPEFAVDSYKVKASNYLLKPIAPSSLFNCLSELITEIGEKDKSISIKSSEATYHVKISEIEYLEAQNKHVLFVLSDGRNIRSNQPFYVNEEQLLPEDGFFKCHRSYLINLYHIESFSIKEVTMRSGYRIPISRSCHKDFEAAYFAAYFGKEGDS